MASIQNQDKNQSIKSEKEDMRKRVEEAHRVLRADYYGDVRLVAEELKQQIEDGDFASREHFMDVMHETIDGHRRVIMTWQAMQGVIFSSQDSDLGIEEFGVDSFNWSHGIPWSQLMYPILERDVIECLDTMGVDVNDPLLNSEEGA